MLIKECFIKLKVKDINLLLNILHTTYNIKMVRTEKGRIMKNDLSILREII